MQDQNNTELLLTRVITRLSAVMLLLATGMVLCITILLWPIAPQPSVPAEAHSTGPARQAKAWSVPVVEGPDSSLLLYGKDLVVLTSRYFGAAGILRRGAINGMNCQNCHLEAGTKYFGNNYSAVAANYPKYRARSGTIENLYKRINDCFERSLNGKPLDPASNEMAALAAYISWLGKDVPKGEKPDGSGLKELPFIDRAADPTAGRTVYIKKCQSCHQADGGGKLIAGQSGYLYPPLWGDHSYTDGAGLYRLSNFAKFVRVNMPQGATAGRPQLTDEEAWDVAAFVNSQPRPHLDASSDWPKIGEKPVDHPFGPYTDGFDEKEHKFGPFKTILKQRASAAKT